MRPVVESLLQALVAGGRVDEATRRRAAFDARGWADLAQTDVDELLEAIKEGVAAPAAEPEVEEHGDRIELPPPGSPRPVPCSVRSRSTTASPAGPWSPHADFGAFVDAIDDGCRLLAATQELATADTFGDALDAARAVFVEVLGFEPADLDERRRLGGETIREHRVVARYGRFAVSVCAYAFPWSWPTVAEPVFRLHPQGLVIGVAPGWNSVRFFVRRVRGSDSGNIRFRTLAGWSTGRDALDNLVVWVGRLGGLRPRFGDDESALMERSQRQLLCDPADLAVEWRSVPLDPTGAVPGISWEDVGGRGEHGFLQPDSEERWFWGLQRVLLDRFPLPIGPKDRGCKITFLRYEIDEEDAPSLPDALATAATWRREVTLHLEVVFPGGARLPLPVRGAVPRCTSDGRMVLDGRWYRFSPSVGERGRLVTGRLDSLDELDEDYLELYDVDELEPMAPTASGVFRSPVAEDTEDGSEEESPETTVEEDAVEEADWDGGSLGSLLEIAVTRKLSAIVRRTVRLPHDTDAPSAFLNVVRGLSGDEGIFLLTSKRFLLAALEPVRDSGVPVEQLTTVRSDGDLLPGFVPSWACIEASAGLPAGRWYPISSARLTPWAGLAVPTPRGRDELVLGFEPAPALQVNPRLEANSRRGPEGWWIAQGLDPLAGAKTGTAHGAASVLASGARVDSFFGVRVPGSRLRVLVDRAHLTGLQRKPINLVRRIPQRWSPGDEQDPVAVTVQVGDIVEPGQVWLRAPKGLWNKADREAPQAGPEQWLLEAVLGQESGGRPTGQDDPYATWAWKIPAGLKGTVVAASVEPVRLPGGIQVAWLARLEIRASCLAVRALLPDGRSASVEELLPIDAPYASGDGEPASVVIEDPSQSTDWNNQVWFDGTSGDFLEGAEYFSGPIFLSTLDGSAAVEGPDWRSPRRLLDGDGIPGHPRSPAIPTWLMNYWAGADPAGFAAIQAEARAWNDGHAPWSGSLGSLAAAVDCATRIGGVEKSKWRTGRQPWDRFHSDNKRLSTRFPIPWQAPWSFRCVCGATARTDRLLTNCPTCETPVLRRLSREATRLPFIELPIPVPHPWRTGALGALLGLTGDEVEALFVEIGPEPLLAAVEDIERPWAAVEERLARGTGAREERLAFAAGLEGLQTELRGGGPVEAGRFLITRVPVLPPALAPAGMPARASALVGSALARAYRRLSAATDRYSKVQEGSSGILLELARGQLLESLGAVFGQPDEPPGTSTLAALAKRVLPPTRPARLRSVPHGLVRLPLPRPLPVEIEHLSPPTSVACSTSPLERTALAVPATGQAEGWGVVTAERIRFLAFPSCPTQPMAEVAAWREREARQVFFTEHLPFLAVVVGGLASPETPPEAWPPAGGPATDADPRQPLLLIRALFRAAGDVRARVADLSELLADRLPRQLPSDGEQARAALRPRVEAAFPDVEWELVDDARTVLLSILTGWWSVPPAPDSPYGWLWSGDVPPEDLPARRRVPPIASAAWRAWPGVLGWLSPAKELACKGTVSVLEWHPWLRLAAGLDVALPEGVTDTTLARPEPRPRFERSFGPIPGQVWPSASSEPQAPPTTDAREPGSVEPPVHAGDLEVASPADASATPDEPGPVLVPGGLPEQLTPDAEGATGPRILRVGLRDWLGDQTRGSARVD